MPQHSDQKLKEKERRRNPAGSVKDGMRRAETGSGTEMLRGLGWKGFLTVLAVLFILFILFQLLR